MIVGRIKRFVKKSSVASWEFHKYAIETLKKNIVGVGIASLCAGKWNECTSTSSPSMGFLRCLLPRSFHNIQKTARSTFGRHRLQFIIAFIISFTFLLFLLNPVQTYQRFRAQPSEIFEEQPASGSPPAPLPLPPPPKYEKLRQWEANLPQHNLDLPFPEGRTGRYVKFSNQIVMLGWNNVFNEM